MARTIRKEIKQPDKFQIYASRALRWTAANRKPLTSAGAVLAAVIIAAGGYRFWAARIQRRAALSYAIAESAKAGKEAEEALLRTAGQFPGTRPGIMARLHLASLLQERGAYADAEGHYRILLGAGGLRPTDLELAKRGLAAGLAAQKKCGEALPVWQEILAKPGVLNAEDLYIAMGECHEQEGRPTEALKAYETLSQKYPRSPYLNSEVRKRMKKLAR